MTRLRWAILALVLSGTMAALAVARPGLAGGAADSPEARLRARIVDLRVDVAVLEVECQAAREILLESLKKVGRIDLGDRETALAAIRDELEQVNLERHGLGRDGAWMIRGRIVSEVEMAGSADEKQLLVKFLKQGDDEKDRTRLAGAVLNARLQLSRAEADRIRADFQKRVRSLQTKRRELDDGEAEYKATR